MVILGPYIVGLDQAVTESHFCCSSLDIFLMEKVRKSCFIWLCRALKVLLNATFFQKFLYHVVGKFVLHRFHHNVRC